MSHLRPFLLGDMSMSTINENNQEKIVDLWIIERVLITVYLIVAGLGCILLIVCLINVRRSVKLVLYNGNFVRIVNMSNFKTSDNQSRLINI